MFKPESEKPIEVKTVAVDKTPLAIADPDPLKSRQFEWYVVTPDNAEGVFKRLEEAGQDLVLFAITADGYQQLSLNIADLRNFVNTQRNIIIKYKEYYEPAKPVEEKK